MTIAIGIDVGGTKIAGGLFDLESSSVLARRLQATEPTRGGEAVLGDVVAMVRSLGEEGGSMGPPSGVGVGLAELVSPVGEVVSDATIKWKDIAVARRIESETSLRATIEADVRAAARAEAELGAGRGRKSFVYVTVGTGISACLVIDGEPYTGHRGLAGSFASAPVLGPSNNGELISGPPIEQFSAGPALAARLAARLPSFDGASPDVLTLAEAGNAAAVAVVDLAGRALGAAIAQLVNVLDPEVIVIGGGLGLAQGRYRSKVDEAIRTYIYSDCHREIPLLYAQLETDAGWIGAALCTRDLVTA